MDEAEHCGRLGILDRGRLLGDGHALATPSGDPPASRGTSSRTVPAAGGPGRPRGAPGVAHATLLGDRIHLVAEAGALDRAAILDVATALAGAGARVAVEAAEITLDDVFTSLTSGRRAGGTGGGPMRARLFAIIRKEAIHIRRDPRTLGLTFVMPLAMLLLLGFAVQSDVRHLPLAVWDQDRSAESRALLEAYLAPDYFELRYEAGSDAELEQLIAAGDAHVGMIIPPGYGEAISSGRTSQVAFVIDGSDPVIAQTALAAAAQLGQAASVGIIEERLDAAARAACS